MRRTLTTLVVGLLGVTACGHDDTGTSETGTSDTRAGDRAEVGEFIGTVDDRVDWYGPGVGSVLADDAPTLAALADRVGDDPAGVAIGAIDPEMAVVTALAHDGCNPLSVAWWVDDEVLRAELAHPDDMADCVEPIPVLTLHRIDRADIPDRVEVVVGRVDDAPGAEGTTLGTIEVAAPTTSPGAPPTEPSTDEEASGARLEPEVVGTVDEHPERPWPTDVPFVFTGSDDDADERREALISALAGDESARDRSAGDGTGPGHRVAAVIEALEAVDLDEVVVVAHHYDVCPVDAVTWWMSAEDQVPTVAPQLEHSGIVCEAPIHVIDVLTFDWSVLDIDHGDSVVFELGHGTTESVVRPAGA